MPQVGELLTKEQTSIGMERLKPQQQTFQIITLMVI